MEAKKIGILAVIRKYFGYRPGDELKDFSAEVRQVTEEDKLEPAQGAAANLGLTQDQVQFPLT